VSSNSSGKNDFISVPKGGGALSGMGEKFSPDLFTGTGNFSIPISIPKGRSNFQPELTLQYSTGNPNSEFGLGWSLGIPGVSRKTSKGIPLYNDCKDIFVLSGFEDLVKVNSAGHIEKFRPRTEGVFAEILFHKDTNSSFWEVKNKNGLVSYYGTAKKKGIDSCVVYDPQNHEKEFRWNLSETTDPFGNTIKYTYINKKDTCNRDQVEETYLDKIEYINLDANKFLVYVKFNYEERTDAFSGFKSGFELRTSKRVRSIEIISNDPGAGVIKKYNFTYSNDSFNRISLLRKVHVSALNDDGSENTDLAALEFSYSPFAPEAEKKLTALAGDIPQFSLKNQRLELIDLDGNSLPDIVRFDNEILRYKNNGDGSFSYGEIMQNSPSVDLATKNFSLIDADGDGRVDLLLSGSTPGYFPLGFNGKWDNSSLRPYSKFPHLDIKHPNVRLLDLTGDGITDIVHTDSAVNYYFNNEEISCAWLNSKSLARNDDEDFPNVVFSDPRVKTGDMNGDGMQDIVFVEPGRITYWPNKGYGNWGNKVVMKNSPTLPSYLELNRVLIGDIDGDGLADIVLIENDRIKIYINQSGTAWSNEITISGTPSFASNDDVRIVDLFGKGISGILWSSERRTNLSGRYFFLELTGTNKPYLLTEMNNGIGAVTRIGYGSSARHFVQDSSSGLKWKTHLPFPVLTVDKVSVIDQISKSKLVTQYKYHHGHFDGEEREFRGFGMVEQSDTETFDVYHKSTFGEDLTFNVVDSKYFSPPTLTKTWFNIGPVRLVNGDWHTARYDDEFYQLDKNVFLDDHLDPAETGKLNFARQKRDALRSLRGKIIRQEFYAADKIIFSSIPFSVKDFNYDIRVEYFEDGPRDKPVIFPFLKEQRETVYEGGDDPLTMITIIGDHDSFGQPRRATKTGLPRRMKYRLPISALNYNGEILDEEKILATHTRTTYNSSSGTGIYIRDRICEEKTFSLTDGAAHFNESDPDDLFIILTKQVTQARVIHNNFFGALAPSKVRLESHNLNYYDGAAFTGLEFGKVGMFGALTRSETLVFTESILAKAYSAGLGKDRRPVYLGGSATMIANTPPGFGNNSGYKFKNTPPYETGYYFIATRNKYDFQSSAGNSFGLLLAVRDPLENETIIGYDSYNLFPALVIDEAGNTATAEYNYNFFSPAKITDVNGNKDLFVYTPFGLPYKIYKMSRNNNDGGTENNPDLAFNYSLRYIPETGQPIFIETIARIEHAKSGITDDTIVSREYSDGLGRLIQKKVQADNVLFSDTGENVGLNSDQSRGHSKATGIINNSKVNPTTVVSGLQIYDNKSQIVEAYEPFYSKGFDFESNIRSGVHSEFYYDTAGRQQSVINPDGSRQMVIYGTIPEYEVPQIYYPSPWEKHVFDPNDLDTSSKHRFTPTTYLSDAYGRSIAEIKRNSLNNSIKWFITKTKYDIKGNLLQLKDPKNREVFKYYHDLRNRVLRIDSIDAGKRTKVHNAVGNIVEYCDDKGSDALYEYDRLNRPKKIWVRNDRNSSSDTLRLAEGIWYGDEPGITANPVRKNLLGKTYRYFDEAGMNEFTRYDFKGNIIEKKRQIIHHNLIGQEIDWSSKTDSGLDSVNYRTSTTYDALNRIKKIIYPKDVNGSRPELRAEYNSSGKLRSIEFNDKIDPSKKTYVKHIAYNAKDQRILIAYGNSVMTRYVYDNKTSRLARLRTESFHPGSSEFEFIPNGNVLQDFAYRYDLAGNITSINHAEPGSGVNGTDSLKKEFAYDAIYRLISATGRESQMSRQEPGDFLFGTATSDATLTKDYREIYEYDESGNFLFLRHRHNGASINRVRTFSYEPGSNRLQTVSFSGTDFNYTYDANGNMTDEGLSRSMRWDHSDRLIQFAEHNPGGHISKQGNYHYDSSGKRIIKRYKAGVNEVITIYIDGIFEHHIDIVRKLENNILHIMDNQSRIATRRTGDNMGDLKPPIQYHLGDHLGSNIITIGGDDASRRNKISKEEYSPYGETTFGGHFLKRYRYSGKERDEESGMYYYGARYYLPWVCRWLNSDPIGVGDGLNVYLPFGLSPINYIDKNGTQAEPNDSKKANNLEKSRHDVMRKIAAQHGKSVTEAERIVDPDKFGGKKSLQYRGQLGKVAEQLTVDWALKNIPGVEDVRGKVYKTPHGGVGLDLIAHQQKLTVELTNSEWASSMPRKQEQFVRQLEIAGQKGYEVGRAYDGRYEFVTSLKNTGGNKGSLRGYATLETTGGIALGGATVALGGLMIYTQMGETELYVNENWDELEATGIDPAEVYADEAKRQLGGIVGGTISAALAGAAVGSVAPGVGTIIGFAAGAVGGVIGYCATDVYLNPEKYQSNSNEIPPSGIKRGSL